MFVQFSMKICLINNDKELKVHIILYFLLISQNVKVLKASMKDNFHLISDNINILH